MKELNEHIRKNGYDYRLFKKSEKGYIYQQFDGERHVSFEVFKRVENKRFECISFPSNEAFGLWAWTYPKLEDALKRFDSL